MNKYLIATHGQLAKELVNTVRMITGTKFEISYICVLPNTSYEDAKNQLSSFFNSGSDEDQFFILTDVFGGSITNICTEFIKEKNPHIVTGVNLPMVLELLTIHEKMSNKDIVNHCLSQAKNGVIYVNQLVEI